MKKTRSDRLSHMDRILATMTDGNDAEACLKAAVDLLPFAQIRQDFEGLARSLAGDLYPLVTRVFPHGLQILYILTDQDRRQVWNAVLAVMAEPACIQSLRRSLLTDKSTTLLQRAYDKVPHGFQGLLARLGNQPAVRRDYQRLFQLALHHPEVTRRLLKERQIEPGLVRRLLALPEPLCCVAFARALSNDRACLQARELFEALEPLDFAGKPALVNQLRSLARRGASIGALLTAVRSALPFPDPVLPDDAQLRFLGDGAALDDAARRYRNCLSSYLDQSLTGSVQVYEWTAGEGAILCIERRYQRWCLVEVETADNEEPDEETAEAIEAYLADRGIPSTPEILGIAHRILHPPTIHGFGAGAADRVAGRLLDAVA